ncbi:alpha-(1,3)-fucosyltransferase C-like [Achroia grisella]|uniref:alpha-(1,3)-fucosyltransferase C-like n=1 Tax=Achroia grisella TaxID=688607 RepID=UPI0027D227D2|nr:alpha-(1,3)-fucosyltransferase C-like [Achroia grisella]
MRKSFTFKLFILVLLISVLLLFYTAVSDVPRNGYGNIIIQRLREISDIVSENSENYNENVSIEIEENTEVQNATEKTTKIEERNMKYILQWTTPTNVPFVYMGIGQQGFIDRKCSYTNCIVTANRTYLGDVKKFDVIAFAGPEVVRTPLNNLPHERSPEQKFVFTNIESSHYYPVCSNKFDGYFNWTWTFRLDSEARWGYIIVRDADNNIIGPNKIMHWIKFEDMDPVSEEIKTQLKTKTKTAAWFVSNCYSKSRREKYVEDLKGELSKYNLTIDVYGNCGTMKCSRDNEEICDDIVKESYYFYLSFENSFSEDYVTEKLLRGLQSNAIPIVYGGANYTRFMPEGIYLNARELGVEKLAAKMNELINNPEEYAEYFRWKKYYSYHKRAESIDTDDYCGFCSLLNNEEMLHKKSVLQNFRKWWDSPDLCS